jgi:predicted glycogen debranching enzyme
MPSHDPAVQHNSTSSEWLVTNGLGGYASGTVPGTLTRRYHGLLIAAPRELLKRVMILNALDATLEHADGKLSLIGEQVFYHHGDVIPLSGFHLEEGLPVWHYRTEEFEIEKRVLLNQGQNTAIIQFQFISVAPGVKLRLRPGVNFRGHDDKVNTPLAPEYPITWSGTCLEIATQFDVLKLRLICEPAARFVSEAETATNVFATEKARGYDHDGPIYSPGHFVLGIQSGQRVTLLASTEELEVMTGMTPREAQQRGFQRRRALLQRAPVALRTGTAAELVLAADQFVFHPPGRRKDEVWARAAGDEVRSVIAGYHWFSDWGRDTMISLEGLTLLTGRHTEAGWILRTFAHYVRDGLIPNLFPEGAETGLYHTADATMWFFHALDRYLEFTHDLTTLRLLLPKLHDIMDAHLKGTKFGIHVDERDGLLTQGAEGYQLTWMDAKVDDWVVTPRRGKAVEINALWYNALCSMTEWMRLVGYENERKRFADLAAQARASFNRRFWCESAGHLYDVVDGEGGDDASCRPNQLFAISLPNPVLERDYWGRVLDVATHDLLTPVGLRSLSPRDPKYQMQYDGDLRARDAAYHQGSVWAWLIGPYVDAYLKVHPHAHREARKLLNGFVAHLHEACIGSISEIFDGDPPHTPRGCVAQAWSVAEVLRCWALTEAA